MSDELVKKQKDILEAIKDKSLASTVSSLKTKIEKLNKFKDKTILADVSGSMSTFVDKSYEMRAIDVVNHVLENAPAINCEGKHILPQNTACRPP